MASQEEAGGIHDSRLEILAYSAGCLVLIQVLDINPKFSLLWWFGFGLIVLALALINLRHRELSRYAHSLEEELEQDGEPKTPSS